ncbi:hypothetical protein JVT61DRAFT_15113 [Boletus reticuloceps]|uniref:Transmembrane protein n=1 Tax=Boletus reticuloceps TaxID=495285 RepID=A0A8I2YUQ4_9AGAM|nr:hypothetical protein JVT61DRAFT_15113 [Boletus reticuloceps]
MPPSGNTLSSLLTILAVRLLFVGPLGVLAQYTDAVCESSFSWMENSKNQNPCSVAAYLGGACIAGTWSVYRLSQPGNYYYGPSASGQNTCECSSVTYNTLSACSLCQNGTIINWSKWNFNCSTVYPGVFTPGIPSGTAVPQWALQDVTTSDLFNVTLAQSTGDNPELTATRAQSTNSLTGTSTVGSVSFTAQPQSPATSAPAPGSSSPGSGLGTSAIIGGVVGGVVGFLLIVGAIALCVMKRKPTETPPPKYQPTSPTSPIAVYTDDPTAGPPDVEK